MQHSTFAKRLAATALALAFSGCSAQGLSGGSSVPSAPQRAGLPFAFHAAFAPRTGHLFLYVANFGNSGVSSSSSTQPGSVNVYAMAARGKLVRQYLNGIGFPIAETFDAANNLYVLNAVNSSSSSTGSVAVFPKASTTPSAIVTHHLSNPRAIAVDASGTLYVANSASSSSSTASSISIFGKKSLHFAGSIAQGLGNPFALGLDASGNLYVLDSNAPASSASGSTSSSSPAVVVYAPGTRTPSMKITDGITNPTAMLVDAYGNVIVANAPSSSSSGGSGSGSGSSAPASVVVYAAGSTTPTYELTSGISMPVALALDAKGELFVANASGAASSSSGAAGSVAVFTQAGGLSPVRVITQGIDTPDALAVTAAGMLFVANAPYCNSSSSSNCSSSANAGSVSVYLPRRVKPSRSINASIGSPLALGLSSS
jgi:hypothetical protein